MLHKRHRSARSSARPLTALSVGLAVALAGCGDGPSEVVFQVIEETAFAPSLNIDLSKMDVTANGVYRLDTVVGTGAAVTSTSDVTIDYVGRLSDGTVFGSDTNWTWPADGLVPGFTEGILGMQVGGSRRLIIPPALGYGSHGSSAIPAGSILIFDVDLLAIQ